MSLQNQIRGTEQVGRNFVSGGGGGGETLPEPDKGIWSIWRAQPNFSIETEGEGAGLTTTDGGAGNPNSSVTTLTTYPWFEVQVPSGFRKYNGETNWFTGRKIILKGVLFGHWDVLGDAIAMTGSSADIWQGVTDIIGGGDVSSAAGNTIAVGVLKRFGSAFSNFLILTNNGGVGTILDTGLIFNQSQRYQWKLVIENGIVTLFVDKVQIATQNAPPGFVASTFWVLGGRSSTGSTFSRMEYMYTENSAP